MATRPIFIPAPSSAEKVLVKHLEMKWYPGFALTQKARSIRSLHDAAINAGYPKVLEISSKSSEVVGQQLSAFELTLSMGDILTTVECAFQGSKVFAKAGPFTDLYKKTSLEAKRDIRLQASGELRGFWFNQETWPLRPLTAFYDWLYINALNQHQYLAAQLTAYDAFSDIAFNPKKSVNCQARSAALYLALAKSGQLVQALLGQREFLEVMKSSGGTSQPDFPPTSQTRNKKKKHNSEDQPSLFPPEKGVIDNHQTW